MPERRALPLNYTSLEFEVYEIPTSWEAASKYSTSNLTEAAPLLCDRFRHRHSGAGPRIHPKQRIIRCAARSMGQFLRHIRHQCLSQHTVSCRKSISTLTILSRCHSSLETASQLHPRMESGRVPAMASRPHHALPRLAALRGHVSSGRYTALDIQ